ncbi:hypothetical protein [Sporosarcina limicola]|uniref:Uncharacterized protein n=1 Tax=Sporosarcina limicola TaxID=34101 RepID=A0A927MLQ1_9BACL|nr:hypothetical protein [Sporosarcina limicola]MBE1557030.1 hypothetical protein [Sporosarcina limicola]
MRIEEISNLLQFNEEYENKVYMPNEIFTDLQKHIKNTPHIAFSYSYIYLSHWLYRYVKHVNVGVFDVGTIKQILGYAPTNQTLNYLIKKGGILDQIEYTESVKDFPISWTYSDGEELEFQMASEYRDFIDHLPTVPKSFTLKYPVKGFTRVLEEDGEEYETIGTFYEVDNTHCILFDVFMDCLSNEKIGVNGFYLYSYLSHRCDIHMGGVDVSLVNLASETGISETSLDKILGALKSFNLVSFQHNQEFFAIGMLDNDRKANTYMVNDFQDFGNTPSPFKKIEIMKKADYFEMLKLKEEPVSKIDFKLDSLPY